MKGREGREGNEELEGRKGNEGKREEIGKKLKMKSIFFTNKLLWPKWKKKIIIK